MESTSVSTNRKQDLYCLRFDFVLLVFSMNSFVYFFRRFVHKTHIGFYAWPKVMEVYAPEDQQPPLPDRGHLESLSAGEKEIVAFFDVPSNIDKLIHFMSLEDRKGKDKFDATRFSLFKGNFYISMF